MLPDSDLECQPVGKVRMQLRNNPRKSGILFAACVLAGGWVSALDQDFSKVQLQVTKVAGNIYVLEGDGAGNIGASVGDHGIVFVDDQYAPSAEEIQAASKSMADKPVRFIINTRFHGDHTDGNAYFHKHAPIIAQDHVRKTSGERWGGRQRQRTTYGH